MSCVFIRNVGRGKINCVSIAHIILGGFHGSLLRHSKYASAEISFVGLSLRWCLGRAMGKYNVSTGNCTISSFLISLIYNQEETKVVEHWNIGILISI